jgi:hypothetical protein
VSAVWRCVAVFGGQAAIEIVGNDNAVLKFESQRRIDELCRNLEQFAGQGDQLLMRQTAMSVVHRFGERKRNAGANPGQRGLLDAEPSRTSPIGRVETI